MWPKLSRSKTAGWDDSKLFWALIAPAVAEYCSSATHHRLLAGITRTACDVPVTEFTRDVDGGGLHGFFRNSMGHKADEVVKALISLQWKIIQRLSEARCKFSPTVGFRHQR
jgi:hypothetical protein